MGETNGGFVLDISERGLCFQPIAAIQASEETEAIRFQMPYSGDWVEASSKTVWASATRSAAGLQFVDLSEAARTRIREWVSTQEDDGQGWDAAASPSERAAAEPAQEKVSASMNGSEIPSELQQLLSAVVPAFKLTTEATPRESNAAASGQIETATGSGDQEGVAAPGKAAEAEPRRDAAQPVVATAAAAEEAPRLQQSVRAGGERVQVVVQLRSRWMVPALVSGLVVLSFGLGVAVGHGSFDRWLGTAAEGPVQNSSQVVVGSPAASQPALPTRGAASASPAAQTGVGAGAKGGSATKANAPRAAIGDGAASSGGAPAASQAATRGVTSSAATSVVAAGAGSKVSQTEHSISASATTAITSRRAVSLAGVKGAPTELGPSFHFGALTDHTEPSYPPEAIDQGIEGTVELTVAIGKDGSVVDVDATSGPNVLIPPTIAAVRIWHYKPTYVNGHAVETSDTLRITFRLPH